jgi:hypothetical protein
LWNSFALHSDIRVKDPARGRFPHRDFSVAKTSARKTATKKRQVEKKSKPPGKASSAKSPASKSSVSKPSVVKSSAAKNAARKQPDVKGKAVVVASEPKASKPAPQVNQAGKIEGVVAKSATLLSIKKPVANNAGSGDAVSIVPAPPAASSFSPVRLPAKTTSSKPRADMPPENGFSVMVDGHHKALHDNKAAAMADGQSLKQRFPFLRIEIFDASKKARFDLG